MKLEVLISAVNANPEELIEKMNVSTDAVLINQCGKNETFSFERNDACVRTFSFDEKGVGLSRNHAIENSKGDILLFSDDDIVYYDDYKERVISEFEKHKEAQMIFFNVEVCPERRTYFNNEYKKVGLLNCGRYPAYSIAIKREVLINSKVKFSPLFGGGAKYSCGEDSLFIRELAKKGVRMFKTPMCIGREEKRLGGESTWFSGYNEKFFFDRGVLYAFLYGAMAPVWGFRFVFSKRKQMCKEIPWRKAYKLLRDGIKEGKRIK